VIATSPSRDRGGRFVTGQDLFSRCAAIAAVLRAADAASPECVSTRLFDQARLRAGEPSLPKAHNLAEWFGMPWPELKLFVLNDRRNQGATFAARHASRDEPWSSRRGASLAMRRVATALGSNELAAVDYDAYRNKQSAAVRALLPTSAQIIKLFGSWPNALTKAELHPSTAMRAEKGMPMTDALALFVRSQGRFPSQRELKRFALDPRWRFELTQGRSHSWDEWIAIFAEYWTGELRRWLPPPPKRRSLAAQTFEPLSDEDRARLRPLSRPPMNYWTFDRVVECVIAYFEENPHESMLTKEAYIPWAKARNQQGKWTMHQTRLHNYGTIRELSIEARRRMTKQPSGSASLTERHL
jgi:hypothetical protein